MRLVRRAVFVAFCAFLVAYAVGWAYYVIWPEMKQGVWFALPILGIVALLVYSAIFGDDDLRRRH